MIILKNIKIALSLLALLYQINVNAQQVTIEKDGQSQKYYLAAEPQYKQINVYDQNLKSVKRESLKQDNTQDQSQAKSNKQSQKQQSDDQPRKQQSRKQKVN